MFSRFSSSTFKIKVCWKKEILRAIRLIIPVCSVCYSLASFAYHKLISCSRQLSGFCLIFGDKWWFLCAGHQYIIRIFIHAKGRIFDWLTRRVTWNFVTISCMDQWFFCSVWTNLLDAVSSGNIFSWVFPFFYYPETNMATANEPAWVSFTIILRILVNADLDSQMFLSL